MFGRSPGQEVSLADFATAHEHGALTVDVREHDEFASGHVPGARNIPLGTLGEHLSELAADAKGQPVFVVCAAGHRSKRAARLLVRNGIDARSVAGGTAAWARAGNRVAAAGRHG
jgi:rhodanese-related sulfurtransferase